jgi:hypothetical protein
MVMTIILPSTRVAVLTALLHDLDREWTAADLAAAAPAADVRVEHVTQIMIELLSDRVLEAVPGQRDLTLRAVHGAETTLRLQTAAWNRTQPGKTASAGPHTDAASPPPRRFGPLWFAASGQEFTIGAALHVTCVRDGVQIAATALVTDVAGHTGRPVALLLTGDSRNTEMTLWPGVEASTVITLTWHAHNGDTLTIGDTASLSLRGYGPNPTGQIIDYTPGGDPVIRIASDRLLNAIDTPVKVSDLLTKTQTR